MDGVVASEETKWSREIVTSGKMKAASDFDKTMIQKVVMKASMESVK